MTERLHGVIPAMVTPRDDTRDEVDLARLAQLTRHLLDTGVHGLFPTGSTGEAPLLSRDQRRAVIETVVEAAGGSVPVLGGAGAASTAESIRLAQDAEKAGATHLGVLPMHFVPLSQDELYAYFAAVADSVGIPSVLYNFPARTGGQNISAAVASRLAAEHSVIGIKDSGGDLVNTVNYIAACPPGFAVFVGSEALIYPALAMGCTGTVCSAGNVAPRQIVALYDAFRAGDHAAARRFQEMLLPLRKAFTIGTFPASVKAAMALTGLPMGDPFPPAMPLTPAQCEELQGLLPAL